LGRSERIGGPKVEVLKAKIDIQQYFRIRFTYLPRSIYENRIAWNVFLYPGLSLWLLFSSTFFLEDLPCTLLFIIEIIISAFSVISSLVSLFTIGRKRQFMGFDEGFFSGVLSLDDFADKKAPLIPYSDIVKVSHVVSIPKVSVSMRTFPDKIVIDMTSGYLVVEDTPELIDCALFLMKMVPEKCDPTLKEYVRAMTKKTLEP
jgi:hypothetical protein